MVFFFLKKNATSAVATSLSASLPFIHSFKSLRFYSPQYYRNTAVCGFNNNFARVCSRNRKCHVSRLLPFSLLLHFILVQGYALKKRKKHSIWGMKKVNVSPWIANWSVHLTFVIVATFLSFVKITKSIRVKNTNEKRWTPSVCEKQSNQILSHKSVTLSSNRIKFKQYANFFSFLPIDSRFVINFILFTISIPSIWRIWLKSGKIFIGHLFFAA